MTEPTKDDILEGLVSMAKLVRKGKATAYLSEAAMAKLPEDDKMTFRSLYPNISLKVTQ